MDDAAAAGKPAVYIETTVISYLTSRPSRDVLVLAHQEMTREWWTAALPRFECFVSPAVVEEISRGDSAEAQRRLDAIQDFAELAWEADILVLSNEFARALQLPVKARADADHLAYASWHGMDYLVTWNCSHIASAMVRRAIEKILVHRGIQPPIICTPEELMGEPYET